MLVSKYQSFWYKLKFLTILWLKYSNRLTITWHFTKKIQSTFVSNTVRSSKWTKSWTCYPNTNWTRTVSFVLDNCSRLYPSERCHTLRSALPLCFALTVSSFIAVKLLTGSKKLLNYVIYVTYNLFRSFIISQLLLTFLFLYPRYEEDGLILENLTTPLTTSALIVVIK